MNIVMPTFNLNRVQPFPSRSGRSGVYSDTMKDGDLKCRDLGGHMIDDHPWVESQKSFGSIKELLGRRTVLATATIWGAIIAARPSTAEAATTDLRTSATTDGVEGSRRSSYAIQKSDSVWADTLSYLQYFVLRSRGTEPPLSSPLAKDFSAGEYKCAGCGKKVFDSGCKFEARTGWPSFSASAEEDSAVEVRRTGLGAITGQELRCSACGSHLGERFKDGIRYPNTTATITGFRYSINGAALVFFPSDGSGARTGEAPPKLAAQIQQVNDELGKQFEWRMADGGLRPM